MAVRELLEMQELDFYRDGVLKRVPTRDTIKCARGLLKNDDTSGE
jgi:hypothetical protein